ncbi:MAG TPA: DUF2071 domain-containing protein [Vicinamibacterales bacterium]|jgi:hypothetical protein|nr:DUF2071 domain-containing protein [Vicinamibacterales bacterium]
MPVELSMDHDFNAAILNVTAHRPWKMPQRPWVMTQTWHDLLFAHWPVRPESVESGLPAGVELDLFDGAAWIGIVPFRMTNVAPRGVPSLPGISEFPEINVRTYVTAGGRPGVYFFSLDAGNALAVRAARLLLNLPYFRASIAVTRRADAIEFESRRDNEPASFRATYEPDGAPFVPVTGSLEYFLTERYCLYHFNRRRVPYRLDIHHPPWKLTTARAEIADDRIAAAAGLALGDREPLLHVAKRQDVVAWAPEKLESYSA